MDGYMEIIPSCNAGECRWGELNGLVVLALDVLTNLELFNKADLVGLSNIVDFSNPNLSTF